MDAKTNQNKTEATATGRSYPDLHDHIRAIEEAGMLVRVDRPINKDTEMHPLVRWQFRGGIEEKDRKAFLFTNVVDSKGNKYDIPVLVGGLAANREIYRLGLGCAFEEMDARWIRATQNPLPPRIVENAPCHEIVITGDDLDRPTPPCVAAFWDNEWEFWAFAYWDSNWRSSYDEPQWWRPLPHVPRQPGVSA